MPQSQSDCRCSALCRDDVNGLRGKAFFYSLSEIKIFEVVT
jgi:hypothetical protein